MSQNLFSPLFSRIPVPASPAVGQIVSFVLPDKGVAIEKQPLW